MQYNEGSSVLLEDTLSTVRGDHQYFGGYYQYNGGCSLLYGIASAVWGIVSVIGLCSILWGYHQYFGDTIRTLEGVQYCGDIISILGILSVP